MNTKKSASGDLPVVAPFYWIATLLALALRLYLMPFQSGDMEVFLRPWLQFIRSHQGFPALGHDFSNYSPAYLYLLVIVSYLPQSLPEVFTIKLWSIFFDFIAAIFISKLVLLRFNSQPLAVLAYFLTLFTPTVVLNSSVWGQCDSIYAALLLACLYCLVTKRPWCACLVYGLAASFKLQAAFFAPVLLFFLIKREIKLRHLTAVPFVFLLMLVPAVIAGRDFVELLTVYIRQAGYYRNLTLNAPNLYLWFSDGDASRGIPDSHYALFVPAGYILAGSFAAMWAGVVLFSKEKLGSQTAVTLSYLMLLAMPFLLPKMHDRYMYAADLAALLCAFYHRRLFIVAILQQIVSLSVYLNVLLWGGILQPKEAAILAGALLLIAMRQAVRELYGQDRAGFEVEYYEQKGTLAAGAIAAKLLGFAAIFWGFIFFGNWLYGQNIDFNGLAIPFSRSDQKNVVIPYHVSQDWKMPRRGVTLDGKTMEYGNIPADQIIAVHAKSRIAYSLPPEAKRFSVTFAVPGYLFSNSKTSMHAEVRLDGKIVWRSGLIVAGSPPRVCSVQLNGEKNLELFVDDAGDGINEDHALWISPEIS